MFRDKITFLKNAYSTKDGKTLTRNFTWLSILQIAGYVFPLFTYPYLARVIGVEGFGKIAFAASIIFWFETIADWGFNYTATRDVAKNRDNDTVVSEIFSNVLWARCLLVIISFMLLAILVATIPLFRENSIIIFISFLMLPGHILFPIWFFQAIERMKYITLLNLFSKLLFTVAVFVFIKKPTDYIIQPLITTVSYSFCGLISFYYIVGKWQYSISKPNIANIVKTIKNSTDVFINTLMPNLYSNFSTVLLGFIGGPTSNGFLTAGSKFITLSQQFTSILSRTFFPYLSRKIDKHRLFAYINISIGGLITVVLFVFAPGLIRLLFSEDFNDAIPVLRIISFSVLFLAISSTYGTNYLIIVGKERILRKITMICSIMGFVLSFPLIYYFDYIGAAITITFSRGILSISSMVCAKKQIKLKC